MSERPTGNFPDLTHYQGGEGQWDQLMEQAADGFEATQTYRELAHHTEAERREARYEADHDPLTGLVNRRKLEQHLQELVESTELEPPLVVTIDLDRFKAVNDTYGHDGGDKVLVAFSDILKSSIRSEAREAKQADGTVVTIPPDVAARAGGEEFILILHGVQDEQIDEFMNALRARVEETPIDLGLAEPISITASFGVTRVFAGEDPHTAVNRSDNAAYESKQAGRNRVTVYTSETDFHTFNGKLPGHS